MKGSPQQPAASVAPSRRGNRIGIGVRHGELAVLLLRRDGIPVASGLVAFPGYHPTEEDFSRAIETVMSVDGEKRKMTATTLHIAVGPNHAQFRQLEAIPRLRDPAALGVLLQENAASFFLKNGVPLVVSGGTIPSQEGSAWAAAFDAPVIDSAVRAAKESGLDQVTAVPVSIALASTQNGKTVSRWRDGPVTVETECDAGVVVRVTRLALASQPGEADALRQDDVHTCYPDAYGAIQQRRHHIRWATPSLWMERLRGARPWCAAAALLLASGFLALGPSLRDLQAAKSNEARLSSLRGLVKGANQAEATLKQQSAVIARLADFAKRRVGALEVLAAFTEALPDSTALIAFHVDSVAGAASIMGRDVMSALKEIQSNEAFAFVEITSAITREAIGSVELERVALKFKLNRPRRQ